MSGLRSSCTRKMAGNRDAQSHDQKIKIKSKSNCKQNSPRFDVSWRHPFVSGKPWIDDCWWRGSKNVYHSIWEPSIMYVVWKILGTLGCYVDNEIIPLKIIYLYFKIELWHLYKFLLPSAKGLSFTLCILLYARVKVIFTFPFFILSFGKHFVVG